MEKIFKKSKFHFSTKSNMAAKNKVALIFSRKYFSIANFILHMEKIFKKSKFHFSTKSKMAAKNKVALIFSRKLFFES